MRGPGCAKVFREKASGARTDRPELAKAIGRLEPGDVLVVTRLDRLSRSTRDLLKVLDELAKRGAGFRSVKDSWPGPKTAEHRARIAEAQPQKCRANSSIEGVGAQ